MRNRVFAKIGMVSVAAACVAVASAQSNGPSGVSLRIGDVFPSSTDATSLGHNWFAFGLDYKINSLSASAPVVGTQSYFGLSADFYSHGGDNDLPVALTYNVRQSGLVFSAGIGPDFRNAGDLTGTGVGLGEQVGVAYDVTSGPLPIFLEAKYFFSSRPELSGLGVYVGVRF